MDGVINIYKPPGMTSFSCVSRVRKLTGSGKAGHAGTLDPQASGVLPVCLGKATKCADLFLSMPKSYRGEITFGLQTDTCDIWGEATARLPVSDEKLLTLEQQTVSEAVSEFSGEIVQIPPDYAAVKIGGVPAYKLARQGKQFEMRSRTVTIYEIHVVHFSKKPGSYPKAVIDVTCSRGTYIRSLFRDIGAFLGTYACMSGLERTAYGFMKAEEAVDLEKIESAAELPIYPIDFLLKEYPYVLLEEEEERLYRNGVRVTVPNAQKRIAGSFADDALLRIYTRDKRLLATAKAMVCGEDAVELKPDKFFDCGEVQDLA